MTGPAVSPEESATPSYEISESAIHLSSTQVFVE
jgi:hypothetical protein